MLLMKLVMYFVAFLGLSATMLVRFILTIMYGPDEASCRAQAGALEWVEENADKMETFNRIMRSPVRVTMPEPEVDPRCPGEGGAPVYMSRARPAAAPAIQSQLDPLVGAPVAEFFLWASHEGGLEISHVTVRTECGCVDFSSAMLGLGVWGAGAVEELRSAMSPEARCETR